MATEQRRYTVFPDGHTSSSKAADITYAQVVARGKEQPRAVEQRWRPLVRQTSKAIVQMPANIKAPWADYVQVMRSEQAGPVMIAHLTQRPQRMVAVKEHKGCTKDQLRHLKSAGHDHIVQLYTAYFHEGSIFLMYEVMSVCLDDVLGTPRGPLALGAMSAICRGVVHGLDFIHTSLKVPHGSVDGNEIWLARNGQVKIGAIASPFM